MNIGFIGIGKIASAVIEGLCTSKIENAEIRLSPRNEENSRYLAGKYLNVSRMESNQSMLDQSDIIFLALRPPQAEDILRSLIFRENQIIVSLIPVIKHQQLARMLYPANKISRAIPLPPVINHHCPIPIFQSIPEIAEIFSHIGQPLFVSDEDQLHALWTLTCLITPYYDLLNELSIWTTELGVEKPIANQYIANLFESLSYTAQIADPINFNDLAKHAATPNGMNEQAGKEIREMGAHQAYIDAANRILKRFRTPPPAPQHT